MKYVVTGIESSGKSLLLARKARDIVERNAKWYEKTGVPRPILSNIIFSTEYVKWAQSKNVSIEYWKQLHEIIYRTECDVFMDEIVKFFNARSWADMSIDALHFLTQGAKSGVHLYGACQDFSQVDKSFRLLVNECEVVSKIIGSPRPMKSRPPVKRIWGLTMVRKVDPVSFKSDNAEMRSTDLMPSFYFITREDCEIFDTSAKIAPSEGLPLKRIVRHWTNPETGKIEYTQTKYV